MECIWLGNNRCFVCKLNKIRCQCGEMGNTLSIMVINECKLVGVMLYHTLCTCWEHKDIVNGHFTQDDWEMLERYVKRFERR
jgi:hypothetical protein